MKEWKSRLIVLETRRGWDGVSDALLFDPENAETPVIIAWGFDAETMEWRYGSYCRDLLGALCRFRGELDPRWAISGCTPDDIAESYGEGEGYAEFLEQEDYKVIARAVNGRMSNIDDLFSEEAFCAVREFVSLVEENMSRGMTQEAAREDARVLFD